MTDLSNTGDINRHVEEMLATHHEHHGEAGHTVGEFNAWGSPHHAAQPANDHATQHTAPTLPATSFVSKYAHKGMGTHAVIEGMRHGSKQTEDRLEHILGNVQQGDLIKKQALLNYKERNFANDDQPNAGSAQTDAENQGIKTRNTVKQIIADAQKGAKAGWGERTAHDEHPELDAIGR